MNERFTQLIDSKQHNPHVGEPDGVPPSLALHPFIVRVKIVLLPLPIPRIMLRGSGGPYFLPTHPILDLNFIVAL